MSDTASEAVRLYQTILDVGYVMPPNEATKAIQAALSAARREGREEALAALKELRLESARRASSHRAAHRPKLAESHDVRVGAFMDAEAAIRASQPGEGGGTS